MGTQITIEIADLEDAGWNCEIDYEDLYEWNEDIQEYVPTYESHKFLVITKGQYKMASYVDDCFCADCNAWGRNTTLFKEAGLLDLHHILG